MAAESDTIEKLPRCPLCKQSVMTQTDLPTASPADFPSPQDTTSDGGGELRLIKPAEVFTHKQYFELLDETLKRRNRPTLSSFADGETEIFEMDEDIEERNKGKSKKLSEQHKKLKLEEGSFNNGYYAKFFQEERKLGKGAYGR